MGSDILKISDNLKIVQFSVWATLAQVYHLLVDNKGDIQSAVKRNFGNCNIVLAPNENKILGEKCKFEGFVIWEPLGDDATGARDKQRLIRFLTDLPSAGFIRELETIDQLFEWVGFKNFCIDIAKCWLAGHELPDNPLARYQMEGMDSGKAYHDYIWLSADLFDNLWKLIEKKYHKIKSSFIKRGWEYPFNGPRHLIEKILAPYIDSEFEHCLKDGHQVKPGDSRLIADFGRKHIKGSISPKEQEKLSVLVKNYGQTNILLNQVIDVSNALAKTDRFINTRLNIHNNLLLGIYGLQQDACRKPELKVAGFQDNYIYLNGFKTPLPKRKKSKKSENEL